jgi:hypothetical protein
MKISNGFFVIEGARKVEGGAVRLKGHLLADAIVEIDDDSSSGSSSGGSKPKKPPIYIPPKFEVKWILPPKTSGAYGSVRDFAESMGYETVEHEDFSYPGR